MRCGNMTMPFYKSVVHPLFEYNIQGWLAYLYENINERVKGQKGAVEMIRGTEDGMHAGGERVGLADKERVDD